MRAWLAQAGLAGLLIRILEVRFHIFDVDIFHFTSHRVGLTVCVLRRHGNAVRFASGLAERAFAWLQT